MTVEATGVVPQWTLADKIRKAREHAGMSQEELAARLTVSRTSVINWERGHTVPLRPILRMVADATGVDEHWLARDRPSRGGDGAMGIAGLPFDAFIDNRGFGWVGQVGCSDGITHELAPENQPKVSLDTVDQYTKTIRMGIPLEQKRSLGEAA